MASAGESLAPSKGRPAGEGSPLAHERAPVSHGERRCVQAGLALAQERVAGARSGSGHARTARHRAREPLATSPSGRTYATTRRRRAPPETTTARDSARSGRGEAASYDRGSRAPAIAKEWRAARGSTGARAPSDVEPRGIGMSHACFRLRHMASDPRRRERSAWPSWRPHATLVPPCRTFRVPPPEASSPKRR
jgi:hypothetical protein